MACSETRDFDDQSITSDFSIIECTNSDDHPWNSPSSIKSEQLQPSVEDEINHGKVQFQHIQGAYIADTDIAVTFILTRGIVMKSSDRVGLYKVGFQAPQEYHSYQWVSTLKRSNVDDELPHTVVFKASGLPKETGEFYQFCYVTYESKIVGVSRSFQLLAIGSLSPNDVCDDNEEEGIVVVMSNQSSLHATVNQLKDDKLHLEEKLFDVTSVLDGVSKELDDKKMLFNETIDNVTILETKLEKESGEKIELTEHLKELVLQKGHLDERVNNLDKQLSQCKVIIEDLNAQLILAKKEQCDLFDQLKNTTQQKDELSANLKSVNENLQSISELNKVLRLKLDGCLIERNKAVQELEMWSSVASTDKDEKEIWEYKYLQTNEELGLKLEQLEEQKKNITELEKNLSYTGINVNDLKAQLTQVLEKLHSEERNRKQFEERQEVVNEDNNQLKSIISSYQHQLTQAKHTQQMMAEHKDATEKVATEMSQRLQNARTEYQSLALVNIKLTKKLKKLRKVHSSSQLTNNDMDLSISSDWQQLDTEEPDENDEANASALTQSCISAFSDSMHTSCPSNFEELQKSVIDLTVQVEVLKTKLQTPTKDIVEAVAVAVAANAETRQTQTNEIEVETPKEISNKDEESLSSQIPEIEEDNNQACAINIDVTADHMDADNVNGESVVRENAVDVDAMENNTDNQQSPVLYEHSFLPSQRTAAVFLPEDPSNFQSKEESSAPASIIRDTQVIAQAIMNNLAPAPETNNAPQVGLFLPTPLKPKATPTARHIAIMSQFNPHDVLPQPQESDDEDFHSTGDAGENRVTPSAPTDNGASALDIISHATCSQPDCDIKKTPYHTLLKGYTGFLVCPMCSLTFQHSSLNLMETHINSHLDHICPVCSEAFSSKEKKAFEDHVHSHFTDEDENGATDNSGPWTPETVFHRHCLLEID